MKTAVDKLIEYFIKEQKEGCSHWCIHDLIAQLYVAKEMEKQQIIEAHGNKQKTKSNPDSIVTYGYTYTGEMYYNEKFKGIKVR